MATPQPTDFSIKVSAPGKVILNGEHSVVYNKLAVAASLGMRTCLTYYEPSTNNQSDVRILFSSVNLVHIYKLSDLQNLLDTPLPLIKASSFYNFTQPDLLNHDEIHNRVKSFIRMNCGSIPLEKRQQMALECFIYLLWAWLAPMETKLLPFTLELSSELTIGAGTGSSASFGVTIAAFLMEYIRKKQLHTKTEFKEWKGGDNLDLISRWGYQSEKIVHGAPSGVDNTICTYGGVVEFRKGTTPKHITMATRFKALLINTKVSRDTKLLVEKAAEKRRKYKRMVDSILEVMDELAKRSLEIMKKIDSRRGEDLDILEQYETLGELAEMNHNLLGFLGAGHPKLDEICGILNMKGLKGKLTGAGGGGYAICLVPPYVGAIDEVVQELKNKNFEVIVTELGGCGVTID